MGMDGGSNTVGSSGGQKGVYGTSGVPASGNIPGGRYTASTWTDSGGNLWLFGGWGYDAAGSVGYLNDLWKYQLPQTSLSAAATPAFSVAAGMYTSAQTVTISDATPGATIYYTTNGTTPTTGSPVYSGPITVSSSETLEAIAKASGYSNSAVASAVYTITPPAATPAFSPAAGTYASAQTVTISDATVGATIYFTTNGTAPSTSSTKYTGPIAVSTSETIEAIATAGGYTPSAVALATYTINPALQNGPLGIVATGFSERRGLAVDASGNVYVADDGGGQGSDVGTYKEALASGTYSQTNLSSMQAYGVAVDASGNVYFAGDNGVSV